MVGTEKILENLREYLELEDAYLTGCVRRNMWTDDRDTPYRYLRGNAILAAVGEKVTIRTPTGPFEAFLHHDRYLLTFRGGPWRTYWVDDFKERWSILHTYSSLDLSPTVLAFHENQGELDIKLVNLEPDTFDPQVVAADKLYQAQEDPPDRIAKDGSRAMRACPHCPVKQECDAQDREDGRTGDWGEGYPIP